MSREKQIEEMAKLLCSTCAETNEKDCEKFEGVCGICDATKLYNAGYRKASEVAEEIFGEIEKNYIEFYDRVCSNHELKLPEVVKELCMYLLNEEFMRIAELKKKYTEGGDINVLTKDKEGGE